MSLAAVVFFSLCVDPPKTKVPEPELKMVWPWVVGISGSRQLILRGNSLGDRKNLEITQANRLLPSKPATKHQDFALPEGMDAKRFGNQTLTVELDTQGASTSLAKITISGSGPGKSELPLEITSQKLVEEKEPNNDLAKAQQLDSIPCRVLGQIGKNQDCDVYRVELKRGDRLAVRVISRAKGSLLDPILTLQTPEGSILAQQGPKGPSGDLLLFQTAKADGPLCLVIQDAFDSGGSNHGYELCIRTGPLGGMEYP